jgi:DNA-directed RNA polymerase subunit RPC12/RpoP
MWASLLKESKDKVKVKEPEKAKIEHEKEKVHKSLGSILELMAKSFLSSNDFGKGQDQARMGAEAIVDHHFYNALGSKDLATDARNHAQKIVNSGVKIRPEHIEECRAHATRVAASNPKVYGGEHHKMSQDAHDAALNDPLISKAMRASSVPRIPKAILYDTHRSATSVLTRDFSSIAKDIHTGPLTEEMINDLKESDYQRTHMIPVYKSCSSCGRTFMAKSKSAECPTCSVNKSQYCSLCGTHLVKSQGGITCPLCG